MTVILLRHGRSSSNTAATLAGRTPGVALDDTGRDQARAAAERLRGLPLYDLVTSPLQRCRETLAPLEEATGLSATSDDGLIEVDYGDWTGRPLSELVREPLWQDIQQQPSAVTFPGGERLAAVQNRAVEAVRMRDRALRTRAGQDVLWVACTHGDVIKSILADALGIHLDGFQRIATVPAAVSVIRYAEGRPVVVHMNDTGSPLGRLVPEPREAESEDATDPKDAAPASATVPGGEV